MQQVPATEYVLGSVHSSSIIKARQAGLFTQAREGEQIQRRTRSMCYSPLLRRGSHTLGGTTVIGNGEIEAWSDANLIPRTSEIMVMVLLSALPWILVCVMCAVCRCVNGMMFDSNAPRLGV